MFCSLGASAPETHPLPKHGTGRARGSPYAVTSTLDASKSQKGRRRMDWKAVLVNTGRMGYELKRNRGENGKAEKYVIMYNVMYEYSLFLPSNFDLPSAIIITSPFFGAAYLYFGQAVNDPPPNKSTQRTNARASDGKARIIRAFRQQTADR